MPRARRRDLLGKRVLGYVNWHRGRKLVHRRDILDVLTRDLVERQPDHIAVTGDLVNLGLPEEFVLAAEWLHHLGPPGPGHRDPRQSRRLCAAASRSGAPGIGAPIMEANEAGEALIRTPPTAFPFVRRFGDVALVALSSAIPTMPFIAAGRLGSAQRAFLKLALEELGRVGLFRVVLIHHPPLARPGELAARLARCQGNDRASSRRPAPSSCCTATITSRRCSSSTRSPDLRSSSAFLRRRRRCPGAFRPRATTNIASPRSATAGAARWSDAPSPIPTSHVWECERRVLRES